MSGARRAGGGEDNILAKLDRGGARAAAGGTLAGGRRVLAALGGLLILGLIGVVAMLVHENAATKRVLPGAAVAAQPAMAPAAAPTPPRAIPKPALAARPSVPAVLRADLDPGEKIVEAAPAAIVTQAEGSSMPPLLLHAAPDAAPRPAPQAGVRAASRPALAVVRKPAAPMAPAAKAEPQAVDSDVALLSAIIMHASSHAAERALLESQGCGPGKKCAAKE